MKINSNVSSSSYHTLIKTIPLVKTMAILNQSKEILNQSNRITRIMCLIPPPLTTTP